MTKINNNCEYLYLNLIVYKNMPIFTPCLFSEIFDIFSQTSLYQVIILA